MIPGYWSEIQEYNFPRQLLPVIAEDRVVQNNLLQKLNELVGEIGRHESLHGDGDVFGILGFW